MKTRPGSKLPAGRNYQGNRFGGLVPGKKKKGKTKANPFAKKGAAEPDADDKKKKGKGKLPVPPAAFGLAAAMKMAAK